VLLRPPNFHCHRGGWHHWTNTSIVVFYSVLGGLSECCFLKTAPHLVSPVSNTGRPPRASTSPLTNGTGQQGQSRHVLSETITTVSLIATPTVACREQLAHSMTARTIWSWSRDIHLFPINNPSLDAVGYSPPAPRWHVKKTLSPTKLQIPATVTTLTLTNDHTH